MNEKPYLNEPGYEEGGGHDRELKAYNDVIQHETIRVALCDQIEAPGMFMPKEFVSCIESSFLDNYDRYVSICHYKKAKDGQPMNDPFGESLGKFTYKTLLERLECIRAKLSGSASSKTGSNKPDTAPTSK